jgi:hypothetical protein
LSAEGEWYLFVGTRKASLLNEFLVNLDRLGLLRRARGEDEATRGRRVQGYLQKFQAIYGELAPNVYSDVLNGRPGKYSKTDTRGVTTLSTATVPVLLARCRRTRPTSFSPSAPACRR